MGIVDKMKKNREIRVKVSSEELEKIKTKSQKVGMTISGFCRYLALNSTLNVSLED